MDPMQHGVDQGLDDAMKLFEKAHIGIPTALEPIRPRHVLLVLDGSAQDELAIALAGNLQTRLGVKTTVLDARETAPNEDLAVSAASTLNAEAAPRGAGESYERILTASEAAGCDLIIVPCPYGRNLESIGEDSAGTTIDVLLARSPVPLLIVRRPDESAKQLFEHSTFVLIGENEASQTAARWVTGLMAPGGDLELLLILETEFYENLKSVLDVVDPEADVSPDKVRDALATTHARLHRSLEKTAAEQGFKYRLRVEEESGPATTALLSESSALLIVLALERKDHGSQGHVKDRVCHSPHTLLVVPDVRSEG